MKIKAGNAKEDGRLTQHWLVGHFIPETDIRHSKDVEIKWGVHKQDEKREEWVTNETRTTISILISGRIIFEFRDQKIELTKQGDYVMWGTGIDHRWIAAEDSVIVTVRWPSI